MSTLKPRSLRLIFDHRPDCACKGHEADKRASAQARRGEARLRTGWNMLLVVSATLFGATLRELVGSFWTITHAGSSIGSGTAGAVATPPAARAAVVR
jgi:hypothetical protein